MNRKRRENHEETLIRHPQNFHYQSFIISVWKYFRVLFKIRHDQPDVQISKKEKKISSFYIRCALHGIITCTIRRYTNCKENECFSIDLFSLIERNDPIVYFLVLRADELMVFEMDGGEGASLPFKTSIQPLLSLRFKLPSRPPSVPFRRINHSTTDVLLFTRKPVYVQRYKSHF